MLKRISMISLGAAIVLAPLTALAPVAALAQTDQSAAPAASAPPAGSHKSQMRRTSKMSRERAHASAGQLSLKVRGITTATARGGGRRSPPLRSLNGPENSN